MLRNQGMTLKHLIKYMRVHDNMLIKDNIYTRKSLLLMGYFHGYKAYRFVLRKGSPKRRKIKNFKEIQLLFNLDHNIKSLLRPYITRFEVALKSYIIHVISVNSDTDINSIFENHTILKEWHIPIYVLYKNMHENPKKLAKYIQNTFNTCSLKFKSHKTFKAIKSIICTYRKFYYALTDNNSQSSRLLKKHYFDKFIKNTKGNTYVDINKKVPIWTAMNFSTFGNLLYFIKYLLPKDRMIIQKFIGVYNFNNNLNGAGKLLYRHIKLLLPLRNALAHDGVIFDCRFNGYSKANVKPEKELSKVITDLRNKTGISYINFQSIEDYFILIFLYLYHMSNMSNSKNRKQFMITILKLRLIIIIFFIDIINDLGYKHGKSVFYTIFDSKIFDKFDHLYQLISLNPYRA